MIANLVGGIAVLSLATYLWSLDSRVTVIEQAKPTQPTLYGSAAPDIDKSTFIPVAAPYTSLDGMDAGGTVDTSLFERASNSSGPMDGNSRVIDPGQSTELNSSQTKQALGFYVDAEKGYPDASAPAEVVNIGQVISAPVP